MKNVLSLVIALIVGILVACVVLAIAYGLIGYIGWEFSIYEMGWFGRVCLLFGGLLSIGIGVGAFIEAIDWFYKEK